MKNFHSTCRFNVLILIVILLTFSCKKLEEFKQQPELEPLQQGLKTSTAIGYCASIAVSAFTGKALPSNVVFNKNLGMIYVTIDKNHPLPFSKNTGEILIAGLWQNNGGIISILFGNVDILEGKVKLYGLYTVPVIKRSIEDDILVVFAKQDIILGYGSDTILNLGNISDLAFNTELNRLNNNKPTDAFVAVKQNVWFINIDQAGTDNNVYDDNIIINGGGQIVEVAGASGGVLYHAMINARINYSICNKNPIEGFALTQNFKAGGELFIDLGNAFMSFHNQCDGMVHIDFCSGKYISYYGKSIPLNLE
jgi:hypothetical protein